MILCVPKVGIIGIFIGCPWQNGYANALLKPFRTAPVRLTAEGLSEHFEGGFGQQLTGFAGGQRRTHRAFQPAEKRLDRPPRTISFSFQIFFTHPAPPKPAARAVGPLFGRFDHTFRAPIQPALVMHPLRIANSATRSTVVFFAVCSLIHSQTSQKSNGFYKAKRFLKFHSRRHHPTRKIANVYWGSKQDSSDSK